LILFAVDASPRHRLILAANRDEFFTRSTEPVHAWPDLPIIGGRDLQAGGTWMGVSTVGTRRLAAVTNVRDGVAQPMPDKRSRGTLPVDFLTSGESARVSADELVESATDYAPVNLIVDDGTDAYWATNHPEPELRRVEPGVHGLSNGLLDEPWPKVSRGVAELSTSLDAEPDVLLDLLHDTTIADDAALPHTGVSREQERALSPLFIDTGDYGTRASTVVRIGHDGHGDITERRYAHGQRPQTVTLEF
jgi:uncharacterized protein with NRDE domain